MPHFTCAQSSLYLYSLTSSLLSLSRPSILSGYLSPPSLISRPPCRVYCDLLSSKRTPTPLPCCLVVLVFLLVVQAVPHRQIGRASPCLRRSSTR